LAESIEHGEVKSAKKYNVEDMGSVALPARLVKPCKPAVDAMNSAFRIAPGVDRRRYLIYLQA